LIVSGEPDEEAGNLTVIARAVVPDDFLLLTPLANTVAYLDDLSAVEPMEEGGQSVEDSGPCPPVARPSGSWVDFVCGTIPAT
jgi:hypothetical protein